MLCYEDVRKLDEGIRKLNRLWIEVQTILALRGPHPVDVDGMLDQVKGARDGAGICYQFLKEICDSAARDKEARRQAGARPGKES